MNTHDDDRSRANYLDRCRDLIARNGHMIQGVLPTAQTPGWAYTVGLSAERGFELLMFGLDMSISGPFINAIARRLGEAPIRDGQLIEGVANMPLRLQTLPFDPDRCPLSVAVSLGYRPGHVRIIQWPDVEGHFPGDPKYRHLIGQTFSDILPPTSAH